MAARSSLLPREGFHADVIGSLIKRTLLNPFLLFPALALALYPDHIRALLNQFPQLASRIQPILDHLCEVVARPKTISRLKTLAWLASIRIVNGWLNRRALNNGASDVYDWKKEIVLITGGSDGIGKQVVLLLASKGISVAVLDIQPLTYKAPPGVSFVLCDITSSDSVAKAAQQIRQDVGDPTILVNNAGVCYGKSLLESTEEDIRLTFEVNSMSHYRFARQFLPSMIKKNHGMIVTMASMSTWVTTPKTTEYAASKAAAQSFHEGLSAELVTIYKAPRVRTVIFHPGYTMTSLFQGFGVKPRQFMGPALHVDTLAEAIVEQILSGKSGQIIIPGFYKSIGRYFRTLPLWFQHASRIQFMEMMKNFSGRSVVQPGRKS